MSQAVAAKPQPRPKPKAGETLKQKLAIRSAKRIEKE